MNIDKMNQIEEYISTFSFRELRNLVITLNLRKLLPKKYTKLHKTELFNEVIKQLMIVNINGKPYLINNSCKYIELISKEERRNKEREERERQKIKELIIDASPINETVNVFTYDGDDSEIEDLCRIPSDDESD